MRRGEKCTIQATILDLLADPDHVRSAQCLAREISEPLARIAYHLRVLERAGKIAVAGTMQRRGGGRAVLLPHRWLREERRTDNGAMAISPLPALPPTGR